MTSTFNPSTDLGVSATAAGGQRWASTGWMAGLLAIPVFGFITGALMVPTDDYADNVRLVEHLRGKANWIWAFQSGSVAIALLVAVFGIGLRRRLAGQTPAGSLLPDLAAVGMLLVAALTLVGGGISTEMAAAVRNIDDADPDTIGAHLAIFNTLGWVWAGGVLATAATAIAGLRHGAVSRGLARFSAAMTVLIALTQLVPLQYLAVLPVTLFLIVGGISLQREGRDDSAATAGSSLRL